MGIKQKAPNPEMEKGLFFYLLFGRNIRPTSHSGSSSKYVINITPSLPSGCCLTSCRVSSSSALNSSFNCVPLNM